MSVTNISKINLYCQKLKLNPLYFEILKKGGEEHRPVFQVSCTFEKHIEMGEGSTLKNAREDAAAKIVELLEIDLKLKDFENDITYTIDSYNVPVEYIWENNEKEYVMTIRKKQNKAFEYKKFKVNIIHMIDN